MRHPLPERHGLGGRGRKRGFCVVDRVWRWVEEEHEEEEGLEGSIVECDTGLSDLEHSMWLWRFLKIEQDVADLDGLRLSLVFFLLVAKLDRTRKLNEVRDR